MRTLLIVAFAALLLLLLGLTIVASLDRGVFTAARELWPDPWFRATLADAYIGFFTIWVWIATRQKTAVARLSWLALIFVLGNIAIAAYVLTQLIRMRPGSPLSELFAPPSGARKPSA